jgi:hypothetical protein
MISMSKKVDIPFTLLSRAAIANGRKVCTTRAGRLGEVGDWFVLWGQVYVLADVQERNLGDVALELFRQEGFDSPEAFINYWQSIHRKGFDEGRTYYVHWFGHWVGGCE